MPPVATDGGMGFVSRQLFGKANMAPTEWISVPEAADMLGCTDVWVIKLINAGTLRAFRLNGRAWAVSRKSAEENLAEYLKRDPTKAGRPRSAIN
jgi:excisionase family DNA binding protein